MLKSALFALTSLACSSAFVSEPLSEDVPIAIHQLVVVETAKDSVIRLKSFDENSYDVRTTHSLQLCMFILRFTLANSTVICVL